MSPAEDPENLLYRKRMEQVEQIWRGTLEVDGDGVLPFSMPWSTRHLDSWFKDELMAACAVNDVDRFNRALGVLHLTLQWKRDRATKDARVPK